MPRAPAAAAARSWLWGARCAPLCARLAAGCGPLPLQVPGYRALPPPCLARPAAVGSIFGIYEPSEECRIEDMDDPEEMMKK